MKNQLKLSSPNLKDEQREKCFRSRYFAGKHVLHKARSKAKPTEYILDKVTFFLPCCPTPCVERSG